eukprot:TRINITY_DN5225_c0_g1_i2.p1 TRINITY_DN5225_c0_g1~~TRINITY_DN5225_c0_g1_i2.p1  ORF type:complete len:300 (+),score=51.50 TRINITY_DN5225_c0_g1_i2:26-901(+)
MSSGALCFPPAAPSPLPLQQAAPPTSYQINFSTSENTIESNPEAVLGFPDCLRASELEKALQPVLKDLLSQEQRTKGKSNVRDGNCIRWWTRPNLPLLCPITKFPICLLPYPPFKLRADPKRSSPHHLVDGKFLAMHIIFTGQLVACGRKLEASDIKALDDYVQRCKLGPYRPGRAITLSTEIATAESPQARAKAQQDMARFVTSARMELGKLRRIQENRMIQINKALPPQLQDILKIVMMPPPEDQDSPHHLLAKPLFTLDSASPIESPQRPQRRPSSNVSTTSTCSSEH